MKILITCAVWKRPEVFQLMTAGLQRMRRIMDTLGVESQVLFVLDETDEENCRHVFNLQQTDCNILFTHISNDMPLGERMNRMMFDCDGMDYDYMMQMGSDDLITDAGVLSLMGYAFEGCPFFGFNQIYFVNPQTEKMKPIRTSNTFGAGRMIYRELVEKTHVLWDANQRSGLDNMMQANVYGATNTMPVVVNTWRPQVFDIKSDVNINKYGKIANQEFPLNYDLCDELKHCREL